MPQLHPEGDRGEKRKDAEAERDRHTDVRPACHARPVAHDRSARDEEGEGHGEQQANRARQPREDERKQQGGDDSSQQVENLRPLPRRCSRERAAG
jgi:hypothetical protein